MKKIILSIAFAALALSGFSACSSSASAKEGKDEGLVIKERIENCSDSDSLKIYVQQAHDYAAKLEAEGKGRKPRHTSMRLLR